MGKDDANDGWKPAEIEPIGHWVQSHNGRVIPLPSFDCPESITLTSTAWVLAGINRFGARTVGSYYNVAHHSVLVARLVRDLGGTVLEQFQALNHEGDESLLGFDPPAPLVRVCPDLRRLKHTAHVAYCNRYGLPIELPEVVKHADAVLLATEKRDLMREPPRKWQKLPDPLPDRIEPWTRGAPPRMRFRARWKVLAAAAGFEGEE